MRAFAVLIGLLSGLLFGLSTPLSKLLLEGANGFQVAGLLYLGAALAFLPHVARKGGTELRALARGGRLRPILGIIFFGGMAGPVLLMLGLKAANASSVSVWLNLELVWTALLGTFAFRDHLDRWAWAGVGLTLLAGLTVTVQEGSGGLVAGALVAAACLAWAMDNHLTALVDGASPQTVTFIKGLFGGAANLAIGTLAFGQTPGQGQSSILPAGAHWALLLGVLSYGLSIALYVTSAQNLGATRSQVLFSTGPFWGILAAFLVLGEPLSWPVAAAMLLLACGILCSTLDRHAHEHRHETTVHSHLHSHEDGHHEHEHAGSVAPGTRHGHEHLHSEAVHAHRHFPDLHHRHAHRGGRDSREEGR